MTVFFQLSITDIKIVVTEGELPGKDIGIVVTQNPADLCDGQQCQVRVEFELEENDRDLPK